MVKLLDEFPNVHQTFNVVPSLITQIQDYVTGAARDPFLEVAAKPARDLTPDERRFALQYLFQANPQNVIGRYPRYRSLWNHFRSVGGPPSTRRNTSRPRTSRTSRFCRKSAWFDEFFLDESDVARADSKRPQLLDRRSSVSSLLANGNCWDKVLPVHAEAAQRGRIEISTSPFYHPILPLVCDTNHRRGFYAGSAVAAEPLSPSRRCARTTAART